MEENEVIAHTKINHEENITPRPRFTIKGADPIQEAHELGFWWVETEDEAIEEIAREVSK